MDRRELLKGGALASAGFAATSLVPSPLRAALAEPGVVPRANRIIFFAYDGLTWEDLGTARYYAMGHMDRTLEVERLMGTGSSGAMLVHSLTSVVTDSSAASSAWCTGRKIVNQAVSQYPDGTPLTTILQLAKDRGLGTGLVTSTRITHATPACWWAHVAHREMEDEIAEQYLGSGIDVLLGGGEEHFLPGDRADGRDLFQPFAEQGYQVLRRPDEVAGAKLAATVKDYWRWGRRIDLFLFVSWDATHLGGGITSLGQRPQRVINFFQKDNPLHFQNGDSIEEADVEFNLTGCLSHNAIARSAFVHEETYKDVRSTLARIRAVARV
jgi:hypothetical protein